MAYSYCICINVQYMSPVQTFINQPRWMFSLLRVSRRINLPRQMFIYSMVEVNCKRAFFVTSSSSGAPCSHTTLLLLLEHIASYELILARNKIWRIIKGRIIWENVKVMLYMSSLIVVKIKSIISGWLRLKRLISAGFTLSALLSFSHSLWDSEHSLSHV